MRSISVLACLALAALVVAVPVKKMNGEWEPVDDVVELGESSSMMPDVSSSGLGESNPTEAIAATDMQAGTLAGQSMVDGTGRHDQGPSIHNMAGAPYGLPGYKESHDWVNDVDIFSPLVFDWEFHGASLDTPVTTQIESKTAWETYVNDASILYPNCRNGNEKFDLNYYMAEKQLTDQSCGEGLRNYLSTGIYDGYGDYHPSIRYTKTEGGPMAWGISYDPATQLYPPNTWIPSATFTVSFWVRQTYDENNWQTILEMRRPNLADSYDSGSPDHDYTVLSGHGTLFLHMNGWSGWVSCTPNDNTLELHSNLGHITGESGTTPGFGTESRSLNSYNGWYHFVHTFQPLGSNYDHKIYLNNKLCTKTQDGGYQAGSAPNIVKWANYGTQCYSCKAPACTPDNTNRQDCGGPVTGRPGPHWSQAGSKEMALLRYFPKTALTAEQVSGLYNSEKSRNDCLKNNAATCIP